MISQKDKNHFIAFHACSIMKKFLFCLRSQYEEEKRQ